MTTTARTLTPREYVPMPDGLRSRLRYHRTAVAELIHMPVSTLKKASDLNGKGPIESWRIPEIEAALEMLLAEEAIDRQRCKCAPCREQEVHRTLGEKFVAFLSPLPSEEATARTAWNAGIPGFPKRKYDRTGLGFWDQPCTIHRGMLRWRERKTRRSCGMCLAEAREALRNAPLPGNAAEIFPPVRGRGESKDPLCGGSQAEARGHTHLPLTAGESRSVDG
jgi:hypothetical protein